MRDLLTEGDIVRIKNTDTDVEFCKDCPVDLITKVTEVEVPGVWKTLEESWDITIVGLSGNEYTLEEGDLEIIEDGELRLAFDIFGPFMKDDLEIRDAKS